VKRRKRHHGGRIVVRLLLPCSRARQMVQPAL
jgi:hypothetical protein